MQEASMTSQPSPIINHLCIIGAGLIGGSIARSARQRKLARQITVYDACENARARVRELGFATHVPDDITEAVKHADMVILCIPVGACASAASQIGAHLKSGAILSDTGSVKASVVSAVQPHLNSDVHFIPGHPVAGTEESGPDAGFDGLFDNRWCILTPLKKTDPEALATLTMLWEKMGANVETMTPHHHDLVLATTSHVPHLIAYSIVGTAADLEQVTASEVIKFSAGGFRDFTRIAASDPTMWRDIFMHNKSAVLEVLGRFTEDLIALQRSIRWSEDQKLFDLFTRTRAIRRGIIEEGQDNPAPDFGRPHGPKQGETP
jgi:cyclohexadieny/prephenate dehydrogenase